MNPGRNKVSPHNCVLDNVYVDSMRYRYPQCGDCGQLYRRTTAGEYSKTTTFLFGMIVGAFSFVTIKRFKI